MEVTRDEIKKAFQDSIERWKQIVKDVEYYEGTDCALCSLGDAHNSCNKFCPIVAYGDHRICVNTPFNAFHTHRTKENAIVELNFLRKVYIWWMEEKDKEDWVEKVIGEKKEEWEDFTEEMRCFLHKHESGGYDVHFTADREERVRLIGLHLKFLKGREMKTSNLIEILEANKKEGEDAVLELDTIDEIIEKLRQLEDIRKIMSELLNVSTTIDELCKVILITGRKKDETTNERTSLKGK